MRRLRAFFRNWFPPDPPPVKALAKPDAPVPLARIFPPLGADDHYLSRERQSVSEDDIARALEGLRGGQRRGATRLTRPARFHIALQHVKGFAEQCLAVQADSKVLLQDMYGGYLVWIGEYGRAPISYSDFDFAMTEHLAGFHGMRTEKAYRGCRFRPEFLGRLEQADPQDVKRRLGMGLRELMGGPPPVES